MSTHALPLSRVSVGRQRRPHSLACFFTPKSIAVIGASPNEGTLGRAELENLYESGLPLFPVNPKYSSVVEAGEALLNATLLENHEMRRFCERVGFNLGPPRDGEVIAEITL